MTAVKYMKVRSSVKKICSKCKIVRRQGVIRIICEVPEAQAASGIKKECCVPSLPSELGVRHPGLEKTRTMARIAGVDLPLNKRVEIGLTYIFGIGRSRSIDILSKADGEPRHAGQGPDRG